MADTLLGGMTARVGGLFEAGKRLLAQEKAEQAAEERRRTKRIPMPLKVQVCVGGGRFGPGRTVDINLGGLALEAVEGARPGAEVAVAFPGVPKVVGPFTLYGHVVRRAGGDTVGVQVDRSRCGSEAIEQYRAMVLFYLRRKPLLEEVASGYFEARCRSCGWVGRVGRRSPDCSSCGGEVEPND